MQWFKDLKVSSRLLAAFLAVAAIAGAVGYWGMSSIHQIEALDLDLYESNLAPMGELSEMSSTFQRVRVNLRDVIISRNADQKRGYVARFKQLNEELKVKEASFEKTIHAEHIKKAFATFMEAQRGYDQVSDSVLKLATDGHEAEAAELLHSAGAVAATRGAVDSLLVLSQLKVGQGKEKADTNAATAASAARVMAGLVLAAVLLAVLLGVFVAGSISAPLAKGVEFAAGVAAGDLDQTIEVSS